MLFTSDTRHRFLDKNPGSDAAGVVGGYVTRNRYADRDVQIASATPGFLRRQEEMPARVQIECARNTASRQVAAVEPY